MSKYHMQRTEREITDRAVITQLITSAKYLTVSMCDGGQPYGVVLSCGYDEDRNCFYFHCAKKGRKTDIIQKNPRVCGTIVEDHGYVKGDCSHNYRSAVVWGTMTLVDDLNEKKRALDVLLRQLEGDPEIIRPQFIKDEKSISGVGVVKLTVEHIDCKGNV
jgi:nitroimidazol reductase NimA-like FMN-containing flavoprotein (pyridoxamine 5'-phosphate oxidase superfamily)